MIAHLYNVFLTSYIKFIKKLNIPVKELHESFLTA